jgi:hypothetical protein
MRAYFLAALQSGVVRQHDLASVKQVIGAVCDLLPTNPKLGSDDLKELVCHVAGPVPRAARKYCSASRAIPNVNDWAKIDLEIS